MVTEQRASGDPRPAPASAPRMAEPETAERDGPRPLDLVVDLCSALKAEGVDYCHWKSNEAIDRSASGDNDLDLLVARRDIDRFEEILRRFRFKNAIQREIDRVPGVYHAYALDETAGRLVHVHAHYQLVLGDDMTKNYRLPIEEAYLASSSEGEIFRVPSPDFELVVFVIRMMLKHETWDATATLQGSLSGSERRELIDLSSHADLANVRAFVEAHLPYVGPALWYRSLLSIRGDLGRVERMETARRLQRALAGCARRPDVVDTPLKIWRRGKIWTRRHVFHRESPRKVLASGGAMVAFVGGDGAGKSTAVDEISRWLANDLRSSSFHLGKPRRGAVSTTAQAAWEMASRLRSTDVSGEQMLAASSPDEEAGFRATARLVWEYMTARDRYRDYVRARRAASNGSLVVCDRFPLPQITLMDGAAGTKMLDADGRLVSLLAARERHYYARIAYPDVLIVLRVDPDMAVQRKAGEEDEAFVRPRSEEIWRLDWSGTPAIVIDAGRPKEDVHREIKSIIWAEL